jgi:hypothetical protein|tara:strand:+ start:1190 stop:1447 length:258 start_codon:yes stop_codon:yes gene_type:complete
MDTIVLNKLEVHRPQWGESEGKLVGKVEFKGPMGKIEIGLDERLSKEVVELCADALVRAGQAAANELTAATLTQTGTALPAPNGD